MSDQVADVFDAAADLLEKDGWCQGVLHTKDGRRCIVGAVMVAAGIPFLTREYVVPMYKALFGPGAIVAVAGTDSASLTVWNDRPERTEQEVFDLLRLTAKQERMGDQ